MKEEKVESYLNAFPLELMESVLALSTKNKWAVFLSLIKEGEMSFTEIKDTFGANSNTLTPILKSLADGGLISKKVNKLADLGDRRKTFYSPTKFGLRFVNALCDVYLPPQMSKVAPVHEDGTTEPYIVTYDTSVMDIDHITEGKKLIMNFDYLEA